MHSTRAIGGLSTTYIALSFSDVIVSKSRFGVATMLWHAIPAFLFLYFFARSRGNKLSFKQSKQVLPHAAARVFGISCLIVALMNVKVGIVNTIVACSVFFVVFVLAPIFGNEKANKKMVLPLMVAIFGVMLIFDLSSFNMAELKNPYLLVALAAMLGIGLSTFLWRKCSEGIAPTAYIAYLHGWVVVLIIPVVLTLRLTNTVETDLIPSNSQLILMAIALVAFVSSDLMYAWVQRYSSHILNGLFAPAGAVFGTIFGFLIKGETLGEIQLLGIFLVVAAVAFASTLNSSTLKPSIDMPTLENPIILVRNSRFKARKKVK